MPARHVGAFYEVPDYEVASFGAPLPHAGEGREMTADPEARLRASSPRYGRPNNGDDESRLFECACSHAGCLTIESGMNASS